MKFYASSCIKIAIAEIGYIEKETDAELDDKTANPGSGNWTKYARDLHRAGYYNGDKNGYPYCDVGVDWCFWKLCGEDRETAEHLQCQSGLYGAGVDWSQRYYREAGRYDRNPKAGDQAFFGPDGEEHTGLVEWVRGNEICVIEFNRDNQVKRCRYTMEDPYVAGFGHPRYEPESGTVCPPVFDTIEQIPLYARERIRKLVDRGILFGKDSGLALTEDMVRLLVINDRAGLYDR